LVQRLVNDEQFTALMDFLSHAIILVDSQAQVVSVNKAAEGLFNLTNDSVVGKRVTEIGVISPLVEVLATCDPLELRREHHGDKILMANHLPLYQDNALVGAVSSYVDVTAEDQLEQRLIRLQGAGKVLDAILENSNDGIWVLDGSGKVLMVSKSWEAFTGIKREELLGRSVYDVVKEGHISDSAALHVMRECEKNSTIYQTRTGKRLLDTSVPVFDKFGNIWRIISNVRDVTELEEVKSKLEKAEGNARRIEKELRLLRKLEFEKDELMVVQSEVMRDIVDQTTHIARTDVPVLLLGESGVGKSVLARLIHTYSQRAEGPFIRFNCGTLPEDLVEAELFGKKSKIGVFELANKGTLFLDEISELPILLQNKVLQAINSQVVERTDGTVVGDLNVRVIAATNKDLEAKIKQKEFNKDFYYTLNTISILVPPLRKRQEDITPLANHFLQFFNKKYKMAKIFAPGAISVMNYYDWPENVRELKQVIERSIVTIPGRIIRGKHLPIQRDIENGTQQELPLLDRARQDVERKLINEALKRFGSSYKAARALGVTQPTIVRKAKKYNIKWDNQKQ